MPSVDEFLGDMLATVEAGQTWPTPAELVEWLKEYGVETTVTNVEYYLPMNYPAGKVKR